MNTPSFVRGGRSRRRPRSPTRAPLISVVVCTRDRPKALDRCLASLGRVADPAFETVVIDNSRKPALQVGDVEAAGARYVHEPNLGLDAARNRGVAEAQGDIVAFIDDDCEADPTWLRELRNAFKDRAVSAVTGRVLPSSLALPSERWFEAWFSFDRGVHRFRVDHRVRRVASFPGAIGTGCNMAYRKATLEQVGPFDEAFDMGTPIGGGGDLDMFARVIDAGGTIAYEPQAIVLHYHRTTPKAVRKQFFGYGVAGGALCTKYLLHRRGYRLRTLRVYLASLKRKGGGLRARMRGTTSFPVSLILLDIAGQLWGPIAYPWSRWRSRRRHRRHRRHRR
jgi:GT2 family glycosyltransferase